MNGDFADNDVNGTKSELSTFPPKDHFIRYYGLYWDKNIVTDWSEGQILGIPLGKSGQGKIPKNKPDTWNCMNFWGQKGVYILYDESLHPVYAGQAGVERSNSVGGQTLGGRLSAHFIGKYRNGWRYFSWFGFLERNTDKSMRSTSKELRKNPDWKKVIDHKINLNLLLSSFEAIIIEGFVPRFNARGGDLRPAHRCDQYEGKEIIRPQAIR